MSKDKPGHVMAKAASQLKDVVIDATDIMSIECPYFMPHDFDADEEEEEEEEHEQD